MRIVLVNATGGKAERDKLNYIGDSAGRALILVNDSLHLYGEAGALLVVGMSSHQMNVVDQHMSARGYMKIMHPDFASEKQPWRHTCITVAYVKRELNPEAIVYKDEVFKYRYVAFSVNGLEIRCAHIPTAETYNPNESENRKERMLLWEESLEKNASETVRTIVIGDFNCDLKGTTEYQDIFDRLPYEKLLAEGTTWQDKLLDNVLISPAMEGKVKAYTGDYRVGITSDHKSVICEIEDEYI